MLVIDPNPCHEGWGPCSHMHGLNHACDKGGNHAGRHRCAYCGATRRQKPQERDGVTVLTYTRSDEPGPVEHAADALMRVFGYRR